MHNSVRSSKISEMSVTCNACGSYYILPGEVEGNLPLVLLCGHIFCCTCLRALESPNGVVSCPECQMDTRTGNGGVEGLEVDSRIIGLIFTACMNLKKGQAADGAKVQKLKGTSSSGAGNSEESSEGRPDVVKVLDEALMKATENVNQLDALHKTFVNGVDAQRKKERNRIITEINEAVDKSKSILLKRKSMLMSRLNAVDYLFLGGQKECKRIEERIKELHTAIQKARNVRQVPSLETYCDLDKILQILTIPVDLESYDMSSLTLCSRLRCRLQVESFTENLNHALEISQEDDDNCIVEEITVEPFQCVKNSTELRDASHHTAQGNATPINMNKSSTFLKVSEAKMIDFCSEIERACTVTYPEKRCNDKQKGFRKHHRQPSETHSSTLPELVHYVQMTHIVNPEHIYVRYLTEQKLGHKLTRQITEFCSGDTGLFTTSDEIKEGSILFVYWKKGVWCRVKVTELFQKECLQSVTNCLAAEVSCVYVYFQDYGFSNDGGLGELNKCLRRPDSVTLVEIHNWAPLAVQCALKDIVPSDMNKGWCSEAIDEMNLLLNETMEMQVLGEDKDVLLVDLKKTSIADKRISGVSLREHLVFMELARFYCPVINSGSAPLLFYPAVQPSVNIELSAMVSHVNSPSDFFVHLVENSEYFLMHSKLQDCYNAPNASREFQVYCPALLQAFVACYDQEWCRVQIMGFPGGRMVDVRYVDFGYRKAVSVKDLRKMKDEFFALPEMALWCRLNDVVSSQKTWTDEACEVFKEIVESKLITLVPKKAVPRSRPLPVCLLESNEDSAGVSIGEILVNNGVAVYCYQTQVKDTNPVEVTAWDPPFEGETPVVSTASEELKPSLSLPQCVIDIRVRVTHVTSPGNICVQLLQFDDQLKRLHETLKNLFSKSGSQDTRWKANMFCAANNMGVWERGEVCNVNASGVAELLRCDFGNKIKVHVDSLRPLPSDLVGSFLLQCNLDGVRPAGGLSTWTATACDFISHYLTGSMAIITIKDSSAKPILVSLFCSNQAGHNVSFGDFLISEGLALKERPSKIVISGEIPKAQKVTSKPQPSPTPTPRTTPPPVKVETHSYPSPELPPCGHMLMNVSAVSEQGVIYAMTPQAVCEFDRLREQLGQYFKTLPRQKNYNWKGVVGCAVMGPDMFWSRAQVQEVIGGNVKVQYVDLGIVEVIPVCHVYPKVLFEDVPQLCVPCQLNGVIPIGKQWQWDAVSLMKELLLGRSVIIHIMEHPKDPSGSVMVELIVDGMPLSQIMVHHQHATFDPAISTQDHVVNPPILDVDVWDLNTEGLEDPQPFLGVLKELQIPKEIKHFTAKVKHIQTPNEVFLCVLDHALSNQEHKERMEEILEQVNENVENLSHLTDFPMDGPCLAEYSDGRYYRAKLQGFSQLTPSVKLIVRHVDFGSDDVLPSTKLRQLPASLHQFTCAVVRVSLAGFRPADVSSHLERIPYAPQWTMKAMLQMIDLLGGELTAVITKSEPQLTVLLYNADGILVHTPLVEKGLAEYE